MVRVQISNLHTQRCDTNLIQSVKLTICPSYLQDYISQHQLLVIAGDPKNTYRAILEIINFQIFKLCATRGRMVEFLSFPTPSHFRRAPCPCLVYSCCTCYLTISQFGCCFYLQVICCNIQILLFKSTFALLK